MPSLYDMLISMHAWKGYLFIVFFHRKINCKISRNALCERPSCSISRGLTNQRLTSFRGNFSRCYHSDCSSTSFPNVIVLGDQQFYLYRGLLQYIMMRRDRANINRLRILSVLQSCMHHDRATLSNSSFISFAHIYWDSAIPVCSENTC